MDRYIGLDVHASSCTLAVVGPSGTRLGTHVVETNAGALIEVLRGIPKRRHLFMEEGTLSGWLHEVLEPHVEELVVTGVGKKSRGPKSEGTSPLVIVRSVLPKRDSAEVQHRTPLIAKRPARPANLSGISNGYVYEGSMLGVAGDSVSLALSDVPP